MQELLKENLNNCDFLELQELVYRQEQDSIPAKMPLTRKIYHQKSNNPLIKYAKVLTKGG